MCLLNMILRFLVLYVALGSETFLRDSLIDYLLERDIITIHSALGLVNTPRHI
jgi:hypothetical protein